MFLAAAALESMMKPEQQQLQIALFLGDIYPNEYRIFEMPEFCSFIVV